jgi:hypothetical protein
MPRRRLLSSPSCLRPNPPVPPHNRSSARFNSWQPPVRCVRGNCRSWRSCALFPQTSTKSSKPPPYSPSRLPSVLHDPATVPAAVAGGVGVSTSAAADLHTGLRSFASVSSIQVCLQFWPEEAGRWGRISQPMLDPCGGGVTSSSEAER